MELWLGNEESVKQYAAAVKAGPPKDWKPELRCSAFKSKGGLAPLAQAAGSTAIVKVSGTLLAGEAGWMRYYGMIGYEDIKAATFEAATSSDYDSIVLYVDSPGGAVNGVQSMAATLKQLAKIKPITVYAATACSAAYWLASAAGPIVASELSTLGSIGTGAQVVNLVDYHEKEGVKYHTFKSCDLKMAGNPNEPLSEAAKDHFQKMVNASADVFFKDIAASRGLDKAKLQKDLGDGRTVLAREALQNRLIDKVGSLSDAIKIAQVEAARKTKRR